MKENKNPFATPSDYFVSFKERLISRIAEEEFPKDAGFRIPEAYFGHFEVNLPVRPKRFYASKVFSLRKIQTLAAGIAAIFLIGLLVYNFRPALKPVESSSVAIDKYIDEGNLKINLFDLAYFIEEEEVYLDNFGAPLVGSSDLESYLIEESNEHFWTSAGLGK